MTAAFFDAFYEVRISEKAQLKKSEIAL